VDSLSAGAGAAAGAGAWEAFGKLARLISTSWRVMRILNAKPGGATMKNQ